MDLSTLPQVGESWRHKSTGDIYRVRVVEEHDDFDALIKVEGHDAWFVGDYFLDHFTRLSPLETLALEA